MNITLVYFLTLFDEFTKYPAPKINAFIGIASGRVPQAVWGTNYQYATALLTAHMLTNSGKSGLGAAAGGVTSEAVGDLSRGFATVGEQGSGDQELLTTRYGQEYVALRRETVVGGMVTGPDTPLPPYDGWPVG